MSISLRSYARGHRLVSMRNGLTGQNSYYHYDHQGTVQCLTDSTGAVTDRFAADAWGVQVKRTGNSINRNWYIGNSGYARQTDSQRYYVRARYLHTAAGTWLSSDPRSHAIRPYSRYLYARNRPPLVVDPTGRVAIIAKSCCDFWTDHNVGLVFGGNCKRGRLTRCDIYKPWHHNECATTLYDGACDKWNARLEAVAQDCADQCARKEQGDQSDYPAAAVTICCEDRISIRRNLEIVVCNTCGTWCCSLFSPDPCEEDCLFIHEEVHAALCKQGHCFGIYRSPAHECEGNWTEALCLLGVLIQHGCGVSANAQTWLDRCDLRHRERNPFGDKRPL